MGWNSDAWKRRPLIGVCPLRLLRDDGVDLVLTFLLFFMVVVLFGGGGGGGGLDGAINCLGRLER